MRLAGNVIWFVFGGAFTALLWLLGAAVFALSIVGLPLTRAAIEMAKLSAFPFGKDVVHVRELDGKGLTATTAVTGTVGFIFNVLWLLTFGLALCLSYLLLGVIYCITIIGIPFGLQHLKLAVLTLAPVGKTIVDKEVAAAVRGEAAQDALNKYRS